MRYLVWCAISFALAACTGSVTRQTTLSGTEYVPPQGRGAAVLVLPGSGGPLVVDAFARDLAGHGLYVLVVDAAQVFSQTALTAAIDDALASPHAAGKKVAVVGLSLGGGYALHIATGQADKVESVVLYYPVTNWATRSTAATHAAVGGMKVPTLIFAGGADTYLNCCTLANARKIEAAAKERSAPLELVVYPQAQHAFNIAADAQSYRANDADDAFDRALAYIRAHHSD